MYVYKNMKGTNKIVMGKALVQAGLSNLINLKSSTTSFTSILSDVCKEWTIGSREAKKGHPWTNTVGWLKSCIIHASYFVEQADPITYNSNLSSKEGGGLSIVQLILFEQQWITHHNDEAILPPSYFFILIWILIC